MGATNAPLKVQPVHLFMFFLHLLLKKGATNAPLLPII